MKIKLRNIMLQDAEAIFEYSSNQKISELTQSKIHNTIQDTIESILNYHMLFEKREAFPTQVIIYENKIVGLIGLHTKITNYVYEIGFELNPSYHQLGIMNKALNMYINQICSIYKIRKIVAEVLKNNIGSIKLLEKNQFKLISENETTYYYERKVEYEKI